MSLPYSMFAEIYDKTMALDYLPWANYIKEAYLAEKRKKPGSFLDLGCGTGGLTRIFPAKNKVGMDKSPQMLEIAQKNDPETEYILADITNFQLNRKFDLIISTHDTLNYIIDPDSAELLFSNIYDHLHPNGLFFGDIASEYNILKNFDKKILEEDQDGLHLVWENNYDRLEGILTSKLRFYKNGILAGEETHLQRYYAMAEIEKMLAKSGLQLLATGSDYYSWEEEANSSLVTFMAKKI